MELVKMNLFKKFNQEMPIGLCSLGLKKENKKENFIKEIKEYPNFFSFVKSLPV